MKHGIVGGLAVCMVAVSVLTGCSESRGVTIPPGYDALPACTVTEVPAAELTERGAPECDLVGSTITFEDLGERFNVDAIRRNPDGVPSLTVSGVGATFSHGDGQGRELLMVNWGVPGVGVALIDNGQLIEIWASTEAALDLHRQAVQAEGIPLE